MYDDQNVSPSKFTNMKKPGTVLTCHMKTAYILYYISPSIETHIKNAKTIDLMEVEKGQKQSGLSKGVENSGDIDRDGEEGNADGYGGNSNIHFFYGEDDNRDGEEKVKEIGEVEASSGDESSESSSLSNGAGSSSE